MTDSQDLILDLNFVPAWARKPPAFSLASETEPPEKADAPRRRQGRDNRDRFDGRNDRRNRPQRRPRSENSDRRFERDHGPQQRNAEPSDHDARKKHGRSRPIEQLPLNVSFLPERHGLKPLIAHLAKTKRAFPLLELAAMFLSKSAYYAVKIEPVPPAKGHAPLPPLWQCAACSEVFLERGLAEAHTLRAHFDEYYESEQRAVEAPKGNFKFVAKCGLSGRIVGPPNYHGYNERILELHSSRYSSMPIEEYRKQIVNESDPALIEQWKQEASVKTVFKTLKCAQQKEFDRRADVEAHFLQTHAPTIIRSADRFIISGAISRKLDDARLRAFIEGVWAKECRFPWHLSIVLRPAFRQYNLHLFKAANRHWFVSPIAPAPLAPNTQTTPIVREILDCLNARPGITRQEVAAALRPQAAADSPEAASLIHEIIWLRDRGHIIEFHDGRLAVLKARISQPEEPATAKSESPTDQEVFQESPGHG